MIEKPAQATGYAFEPQHLVDEILRDARQEPGHLPLVAYAFLVRGFVALVGVVATRLHLGTHYDVSSLVSVTLGLTGTEQAFVSGSWSQIFWLTLLPQRAILPIFSIVSGLIGSALLWRLSPGPSARRSAAAIAADVATRNAK